MEPYRIGIVGLGTVGAGVVRILRDNRDLIARRAGRPIDIVAVSARNRNRDRGVDLAGMEWADDPLVIAHNPTIDAVVEVIGGSSGPALDLVRAALSVGKSVVTANKALLALHGAEIARLADEKNASLMYEAAVAGGIPIIKALREGYAANRIEAVYGILNGTCNYILTEMRRTGREFSDVLADAQALGYAEADPSFDIGGTDAAHKLCLLSALAFGHAPDFSRLPTTGIAGVTDRDIAFAEELGYRIKLLGIARRNADGRVVQTVEPCLVPVASPIAAVDGVFNAVFIEGDFVGTGMSVGRGAGAGPTASAVVADLIDLARGRSLPAFGLPAAQLAAADWMDSGDVEAHFYIHSIVIDKPGVLADIAAILRDRDISAEAVLQRGRDPGKPVSLVITTHMTKRSNVDAACAALARLEALTAPPCALRIEMFGT